MSIIIPLSWNLRSLSRGEELKSQLSHFLSFLNFWASHMDLDS